MKEPVLTHYMLVGYIQGKSTLILTKHRDALLKAGVDPKYIFEDRASGAKEDRAGLREALKTLKSGDCFIVWKLELLGNSIRDIISIIHDILKSKNIFQSLSENIILHPKPKYIKLFDELLNVEEFGIDLMKINDENLKKLQFKINGERIKRWVIRAKLSNIPVGRPSKISKISEDVINEIKRRVLNNEQKKSIYMSLGIKKSTFFQILRKIRSNPDSE